MVKFDETESTHLGEVIALLVTRDPAALEATAWIDAATDLARAVPPLPFNNRSAFFVALLADCTLEIIDLVVDRSANHPKLQSLFDAYWVERNGDPEPSENV